MGERVHPGEAVFGQDRQDQEIHESDTPSTCSNNEVLPGPDFQVPQHQIYDQLAYIESRDHHLQNVPFDTVTGYSHQPPVVSLNDRPGLVFNGYILEPSAKPIPEEFIRIQSGTSIAEPGSILDEESGRTYYNHNTGKYYLPNDAVSIPRIKTLSFNTDKAYSNLGLHRQNRIGWTFNIRSGYSTIGENSIKPR